MRLAATDAVVCRPHDGHFSCIGRLSKDGPKAGLDRLGRRPLNSPISPRSIPWGAGRSRLGWHDHRAVPGSAQLGATGAARGQRRCAR